MTLMDITGGVHFGPRLASDPEVSINANGIISALYQTQGADSGTYRFQIDPKQTTFKEDPEDPNLTMFFPSDRKLRGSVKFEVQRVDPNALSDEHPEWGVLSNYGEGIVSWERFFVRMAEILDPRGECADKYREPSRRVDRVVTAV